MTRDNILSTIVVVFTSLIVRSIPLYGVTLEKREAVPSTALVLVMPSSTQQSTKAFSPGPKYGLNSSVFLLSTADSFSLAKGKRDGGFTTSDAPLLFNLLF